MDIQLKPNKRAGTHGGKMKIKRKIKKIKKKVRRREKIVRRKGNFTVFLHFTPELPVPFPTFRASLFC